MQEVTQQQQLKCNLVLWEVSPKLLDGLRDRMRAVQRIEGAQLLVERGTLFGKKVVVASAPNKKSSAESNAKHHTAKNPAKASSDALSSLFRTLVATHSPIHFWVIGEAAVRSSELVQSKELEPGSLVYAKRVLDQRVAEQAITIAKPDADLLTGIVGYSFSDGPVSLTSSSLASSQQVAATNWAGRYNESLTQSGMEGLMLAAINPGEEREGQLLPRQEQPSTQLARRAGRFFGKLIQKPQSIGELVGKQTQYLCLQNTVADQLETLVKRIQ